MTKAMFELIEVDPETGEENQCLSVRPGTWAEVRRQLDANIAEMIEEWDTEQTDWSWLRIQPAS
jgi:hypothetical protein